jgi:hypothetical protein
MAWAAAHELGCCTNWGIGIVQFENQDWVVFGNDRTEVNSRGLQRVLEIGKRNLAALSPSAVAGLHRYLV